MRKGIGGCQAYRALLAPRENRVPLVPLALWATLDPRVWPALWDKRAQRGLRDPLGPVETLAPQAHQVPRVPGRSCTGCADAGAGSQARARWRARRAAWRRYWPLSRL